MEFKNAVSGMGCGAMVEGFLKDKSLVSLPLFFCEMNHVYKVRPNVFLIYDALEDGEVERTLSDQ